MILELKNIDKSFGEKEVLKGVSFTAEGGKAFGLLGRNGAGKTTSIRILMNVFPANGGEVLIDGKPIDYDKIGIGYLPEERGLYPKKLIIDQLVYFAELKGMSAKDAVKAVDYWLSRLGMSEYRNKRLDTLSKGNQQKVQLAQTLLTSPQLIFFDEPFSGLDPVNAQILKDVIKEQIQEGKFVIFSSHQMSYVEEFCDDIAILNHGDVVLSGGLKEIKREFGQNRLVLSSLGETPEELAKRLQEVFADLLDVEKVQKDRVIVRKKQDGAKADILKRLVEQGVDLEYFGLYEPSLNDIFVEKAGDE